MNILEPRICKTETESKCGEIFFRTTKEFLIYCSICETLCTEFAEFLSHMQTIHFGDEIVDVNMNVNGNVNMIANEIGNILDETEEILIENSTWDDIPDVLGKIDGLKTDGYCSVGNINKIKVEGDRYEVIELFDVSSAPPLCQSSSEEVLPELKKNILDVDKLSTDCKGEIINNCNSLENNMKQCCTESAEELEENPQKVDNEKFPLVCVECNESFPSNRCFHRHCVQIHCGFKCSFCERRFKQQHQCKRHEQTHMTAKEYTCSFEGCSKSFTEKYYLKRHEDIHSTERNFLCDFENCGKAFHTRRRLTAHRKIHTKPKNLICDICGYSCRENETLRVHQRIHTGERPYPCRICDKRFISSSSLGEHMASHASGRPHVCKVCNAAFARQKALYHHRFLHLDVKKFKCKICGSAYKQAAGLAGHMRKHRQERNRLTMCLPTAVAVTS